MRSKLPILFISLAFLSPAWGGQHRLIRCAVFAEASAALHHSGESEALTREALSELHRFRAKTLSQFAYVPSQRAVVSSNRHFWGQGLATRRLSALLDESRLRWYEGPNPSASLVFVRATVFDGDDIPAEFNRRAAIRERHNRLLKDPNISVQRSVQGFFGFKAGVPAVGGLLFAIFGPFLDSDNPSLLMSMGGGLALSFRVAPESLLRMFSFYDSSKEDEETLRAEFTRLQSSEGWFYQSFNQRMPETLVARLLTQTPIGVGDILDFENRAIYPRHTVRYTSAVGLMPPLGRPSVNNWVQVDNLLVSRSGKQSLITVVRVHKRLPRYPLLAPLRARSANETLNQPSF